MLARQNLIAQKNNLQMQMLENSASQRRMLSNPYFRGNLQEASNYETALGLQNISDSAQLMAINAELDSLSSSKLDFMA